MAFRLVLLAILAYIIISYIRRLFISGDNQNSPTSSKRSSGGKEGNVTVENPEGKNKIVNKDEGDYIDYEEIK